VKLFLTSDGLTTKSLETSFLQSLPTIPAQATIAFVTTAANPEKNRDYISMRQDQLQSLGVRKIYPVDVADGQNELHLKQLQAAHVIWIDGGNTMYLLDRFNAAGLSPLMREIVKGKLYVGVSAGSIIATPTIAIASVEPADANDVGIKDLRGFGLVDFEVSPHTPDLVPIRNIEDYARKNQTPLYAFDDRTALRITDGKVEILGDKRCLAFGI
jgi:dipeptidase E